MLSDGLLVYESRVAASPVCYEALRRVDEKTYRYLTSVPSTSTPLWISQVQPHLVRKASLYLAAPVFWPTTDQLAKMPEKG